MDTSTYAEFLRAQGFRVLETASCYWHDRGVRQDIGPQWVHFLVGGPAHRPVSPSDAELNGIFAEMKAFGLKYVTSSTDVGKASYRFVCRDLSYGLHALPQKARNQTRRGLERCRVERTDFAFLRDSGMELMRDSWARGRRGTTVTEAWWRRYCDAAARFEDVVALGAFVEGHLAGFLTSAIIEDVCYIGFLYSLRRLLSAYPNNALVFKITRDMLNRTEVHQVDLGLEPLESLPSLDHFKLGMGFTKELVRQNVVLNPVLRPVFNGPTIALVRSLIGKWGRSEFCRRADGILRFYQESQSTGRSGDPA